MIVFIIIIFEELFFHLACNVNDNDNYNNNDTDDAPLWLKQETLEQIRNHEF